MDPFFTDCDSNNYKQFSLHWQEWLEFILSTTIGPKWHILFSVVYWQLCCYRNQCVFEKTCQQTHRFWLRINIDVNGVLSLQDQYFNTEHKIISWKPTTKPAFKINVEAFQSEDHTFAIGAAIVCDADFQ